MVRDLVGFLTSLFACTMPFLGALLALVSFLHWQTALVFLGALGFSCLGAVRFYEKHHQPEAYDDRLTDERMRKATDELVLIWSGGENED